MRFRRALRRLGEGEAGDYHGAREILAGGGVDIAPLQLFLGRVADGVDEEVEPVAPGSVELLENRVERGQILDIAGDDEIRTHRFGQRLHPPPERIPLIGEGELGALIGHRFRDAPGDGMVVGDAHDQATLALHQTGQKPALPFKPRRIRRRDVSSRWSRWCRRIRRNST